MAVAPLTTAPNPVQAFLWGSNGQALTPAQAAAKQRIAEALIGQMGAPRDIGEGLSSVAHALMAKDMMNQSGDAISAGTQQAADDMKGILADPSKSIAFLANDQYATPGQQAVAQALAEQQTPMAQIDYKTKEAELRNLEGGFPGTDADAVNTRIIMAGNQPGGDTSSLQYRIAYANKYGPKTISVPGIDGVPVIQTITQPMPEGIAAPSYGQVAPTAPADAGAPAAAPETPAVTQVDPANTSTTVSTPGGGVVTQQGAQVTKPQFAANRAMTVAAPALKSLHQVMGSLGDPQNRVALQAGEWGKFLASDDGKKALDSITAIANTASTAYGLDPKEVRDELTPLSTDSQALRQWRLNRADEYVNGLASGGDTTGAKAAVKDAIATPSEATAGVPQVQNDADYNGLASGTKFRAPDGTIRIKP